MNNTKNLKINDLVKIFKLQSGQHGSEIFFDEFCNLLKIISQILFRDESLSNQEKFIILKKRILYKENSTKPTKKMIKKKNFLPEIVNIIIQKSIKHSTLKKKQSNNTIFKSKWKSVPKKEINTRTIISSQRTDLTSEIKETKNKIIKKELLNKYCK